MVTPEAATLVAAGWVVVETAEVVRAAVGMAAEATEAVGPEAAAAAAVELVVTKAG